MEALRSRKDAAEVAALVAAGAAADRVAAQLHAGEIPMVGRTEAEVSADISARLIAEGHQKVNFAIVAAGENAASPHHHAGDRVIQYGEIVLCDAVLLRAQAAGVNAGVIGSSCENVDAVTRAIIDEAGYGEFFVHRTGHGIGMEEHEDPYMVSGNTTPIAAGHAYSVEPGIYVPGKWGMRLEDIVVATDNGPMAVNHANHHLVVLDR
jgi:Xaa-Pro dipeptidase